MTLDNGERQVAPTIEGIRRDHVARYEFALSQLPPRSRVLDLACGVGYGSDMMAAAGHEVIGVDIDIDAINYARQHYSGHGATFIQCEKAGFDFEQYDAVVCFETIEHLADPLPMLQAMNKAAPLLIASVPNETVFPFDNYKFHYRHYTRQEFTELLVEAGYGINHGYDKKWFGQLGPESDVGDNIEGRTLIVTAAKEVKQAKMPEYVPEHVTILGLGPSVTAYLELIKRLGGRRAYSSDVWGINAIGGVIQCDMIFHMDDLNIQESRAALNPGGNIAVMVDWLKTCDVPVITSIKRPGYDNLVEFPLADVLNAGYDHGGVPYFNSTAAYAIAYAIHIGVKRISLFGIDYTLPNMHQAEQGRACCEYWLGIAAAKGIEITVPEQTSLLDACASDRDRLYGYDCVDVIMSDQEDGSIAVRFDPRETIPSAEEVEQRYNHDQHPNPMMRGKT